ncbi:hypothetical protein CDAR_518381 [Caerostris darwini]|uniref:Uncharacterized protein n=1 Tax=Caerostris darwini TaxID=1538125 RepID=A0AAV4R2S1_9ARAC|nr:hypothetical protein CDAR_518381 [Caerostris darwini]
MENNVQNSNSSCYTDYADWDTNPYPEETGIEHIPSYVEKEPEETAWGEPEKLEKDSAVDESQDYWTRRLKNLKNNWNPKNAPSIFVLYPVRKMNSKPKN